MIQVRAAAFDLEVDFQADSAITALFGPAGAGKTLLLDIIAGLHAPRSGRIMVDDQILFDGASGLNSPARRRHCGYVSRNWALFPHMSVRDNLSFPLARLGRLERRRRVKEMLERFALSEVAALRPQAISPTERLSCVFARALIGEPKLLLIDEPASGLDIGLRMEWRRALRRVREETGLPMLLATRDLETCFELADNMFLLDGGRILQSGPPRKVLDQPASVEAARLLGVRNLFSAEITALDPGRNTSRLRMEAFELAGPYFPGHLKGDRVWVCVQPNELRVAPPDGSKPQSNQVAGRLERVVEMPGSVRLEFAGGIVADMAWPDFEPRKDNKDWLVEFPANALRVL
jgi:ABC-type sulfate/molybdate transport systems ATPase subunit